MGMKRTHRKRRRLVTAAWLIDEDQVLDVVETLQVAGFSVTVSPHRY